MRDVRDAHAALGLLEQLAMMQCRIDNTLIAYRRVRSVKVMMMLMMMTMMMLMLMIMTMMMLMLILFYCNWLFKSSR